MKKILVTLIIALGLAFTASAQTLIHPSRIATTTGVTDQILKINSSGVYAPANDATGGSGASSDFNYVVGAEGRYLTPTSTAVGLLTTFTASSTLQRLSSLLSTSTQATTTWLHSVFGNFSTSTIGNLLTGTVTATSTTASSSFRDLFWVDGQATSLSLSGGLTALGVLSGSNLSGTNTGDVTLAGTPNYLTLSGQQVTLTKLDISDDTNATAGVGLTLTANDFTCDTATSGAFGCLTSADWTTFNSKQATISATWPVILTGATLSFGGLSTSTAAVIGNIPYFSGANTFANVATGTVSGSGGINVTAGRSAIGGALAISADCATITGGAGLCDGTDADSGAGTGSNWLFESQFAIRPTSTAVGIFTTSSSTIDKLFVRLSTSTQATSTYLSISEYLKIPTGTAPTMGTLGQIAWDTTSGNLVVSTSTTGHIVIGGATTTLYAFAVASTSPDFISGGTIELPAHFLAQTAIAVICEADAGTSVVINLSDSAATADSNTATCTTTSTQFQFTSNNSYAAYAPPRLEIGTITGAVDRLSLRFIGYRTSD